MKVARVSRQRGEKFGGLIVTSDFDGIGGLEGLDALVTIRPDQYGPFMKAVKHKLRVTVDGKKQKMAVFDILLGNSRGMGITMEPEGQRFMIKFLLEFNLV